MKTLLIFTIALSLAGYACKQRAPEDSELRGHASNKALDVNDVSILFPKVDEGRFYPDIPIRTVWPRDAFDDYVNFMTQGQATDSNGNKVITFGQFAMPANPNSKIQARMKTAGVTRPNCRNCVDTGAKITFPKHRGNILKYRNWRIVGMRIDMCAGPQAAPSKRFGECEIEFRLIAQPFGDVSPLPPDANGKAPDFDTTERTCSTDSSGRVLARRTKGDKRCFMFDATAHLLYKIGSLDVESGRILKPTLPGINHVKDLLNFVWAIKNASTIPTNGKPLGVHPGLKVEARSSGRMGSGIRNMIASLTQNGDALSRVTSMQVAGPAVFDSSDWVFFQGGVNNGHWTPDPITGSQNMFSIRTKSTQGPSGLFFPPPQINLAFTGNKPTTTSGRSIDRIFTNAVPAQGTQPRLSNLMKDLPYFYANPGQYGDPRMQVARKNAVSVNNTDCISCHMSSTRAYEWGITAVQNGATVPSLYVPPAGTTAYLDPEVVPRVDYSLRNFGWFLSPPLKNPLPASKVNTPSYQGLKVFFFPGRREEVPVVMTRTVNESAELVHLLNSNYISVSNPGLKCSSPEGSRRNRLIHARMADCILFESYKPGVDFNTCLRQSGCGGRIDIGPRLPKNQRVIAAAANAAQRPQPGGHRAEVGQRAPKLENGRSVLGTLVENRFFKDFSNNYTLYLNPGRKCTIRDGDFRKEPVPCTWNMNLQTGSIRVDYTDRNAPSKYYQVLDQGKAICFVGFKPATAGFSCQHRMKAYTPLTENPL